MAYIIPADFFPKTRKSWTQGLLLNESAGDDAYLASVIAQVTQDIEDDLGDTFEPPSPDNDITLEVNSYGGRRLWLPRRMRSITSVATRDLNGVLTTEPSTLWRGVSSIAGSEFSDVPYDYLEIIPGQYLSTGAWPYGSQTVRVIGKTGWSAVPTAIKRLTALMVYDYLKSDPKMSQVQRLDSRDATYTFVSPDEADLGMPEADRIRRRYRRQAVLVR